MGKETNKIKLTPAQRGRMYGLIRRLESGKYPQGRHALRVIAPDESVSYCCLGVACQLLADAKIANWRITKLATRVTGEKTSFGTDYDFSQVPTRFESLFGFDSYSDDYRLHQRTYWMMNDEQGKNFIEIAAELRKNFGFKPRKESKSV